MEANLVPQEQSEGPSIEFLKTPSGVLLVVNFVSILWTWFWLPLFKLLITVVLFSRRTKKMKFSIKDFFSKWTNVEQMG